MPINQPDSMLVTPQTVKPMVSPIIFMTGTAIRLPGEGGERGRERRERREGEREEKEGRGGEGEREGREEEREREGKAIHYTAHTPPTCSPQEATEEGGEEEGRL